MVFLWIVILAPFFKKGISFTLWIALAPRWVIRMCVYFWSLLCSSCWHRKWESWGRFFHLWPLLNWGSFLLFLVCCFLLCCCLFLLWMGIQFCQMLYLSLLKFFFKTWHFLCPLVILPPLSPSSFPR